VDTYFQLSTVPPCLSRVEECGIRLIILIETADRGRRIDDAVFPLVAIMEGETTHTQNR
jgi:hypothetical protein